jgi:hypothetical protein
MHYNILNNFARKGTSRYWYFVTIFLTFFVPSCKKQVTPTQSARTLQEVPNNEQLVVIKKKLESNRDGYKYLKGIERTHGAILWSKSKPVGDKQNLAHLIPVLDTEKEIVKAVLVVTGPDSIRSMILQLHQSDFSSQSTQAKTNRLIQYFNFILEKRPPNGPGVVKYRSVSAPEENSNMTTEWKAAYVYSICYDYVVCTGDGYGNCIGNTVYRSECYTSVGWMGEYSYTQYGGGSGDPGVSPRPGGGGGSGSAGANYLLPPTSPVTDLAGYIKCFDRGQPGRLTVFVDQPLPGSDEPFTILGKMGHVFISIEQQTSTGLLRRFFGFHPLRKVNPFGTRSSPSTIANDQTRKYDVYLPIDLTAVQLGAALNAILGYAPVYDLETYNCVDFVLDIASAAGHPLPRNAGWWIFGTGRNPGRLGEDIRRLPGHVPGSGRATNNEGSCAQ